MTDEIIVGLAAAVILLGLLTLALVPISPGWTGSMRGHMASSGLASLACESMRRGRGGKDLVLPPVAFGDTFLELALAVVTQVSQSRANAPQPGLPGAENGVGRVSAHAVTSARLPLEGSACTKGEAGTVGPEGKELLHMAAHIGTAGG